MARSCSAFVICILVTVAVLSANLRNVQAATMVKRSPLPNDDTAPLDESSICPLHTPCGWGVYQPFTRIVNYFMKNTCVCAPHQTCERSEDDVSVSAFIYRCIDRPKPAERRAAYSHI